MLGCTVVWLKNNLSYEEFKNWGRFFNYEIKLVSKLDYYLAQVSMMASQNPKAKLKDFILETTAPEPEKKSPVDIANIFKKHFKIED